MSNIIFSVLAEYNLAPDLTGTDSDLQDIQETYQSTGGIFDVLVNESGDVIGTVGLFPISQGTCELRKMYLSRSARGQGLGRCMLEHAIEKAVALGFNRIILETASVLREAISLYKQYGFRPYECAHMAARCDRAFYLQLNPTNCDEHLDR